MESILEAQRGPHRPTQGGASCLGVSRFSNPILQQYNTYTANTNQHKPIYCNNTCHTFIIMEKALATHSSILAWKIPWMEEAGGLGLQLIGSQRVRHD